MIVKKLGKTVLGMLLIESAVLAGFYLYTRFVEEENELKDTFKKDFKDAKKTLNNLKENVADKADYALKSLKVGKKEITKKDEVATKKVIEKKLKTPVTTKKVTRKKTPKIID